LGNCPWRIAPPKAFSHDPSGCREAESMPLVRHTPMVLEMARRDLTNRVGRGHVCPGRPERGGRDRAGEAGCEVIGRILRRA
jgi:hypothetical protein